MTKKTWRHDERVLDSVADVGKEKTDLTECDICSSEIYYEFPGAAYCPHCEHYIDACEVFETWTVADSEEE